MRCCIHNGLVKFSDPATAVTDYILAAESFALAVLLVQNTAPQSSVRLWAAAFIAVGISALSGGWFHHRRLELSEQARHALWMITALGLLAALALFLAAGVFASAAGYVRKGLLAGIAAAFVAGIAWMKRSGGERFGVTKSATLLLFVLFVLAALLVRQFLRHGGGIDIIAGSMICVAAVTVQQAAPKLHPRFNHNDLCHVLFMIGLFFLYRGGLLLIDKV